MTTLFINGKFLAQRQTGGQRFARCMVKALDDILSRQTLNYSVVLLAPRSSERLPLRYIEQRFVGSDGTRLHVWEQTVLPWAARKGLLLNLSGTAPFLHFNQVATIFDAAIYDHPEAYTRAFIAWYRFLFASLWRSATLICTISNFSRERLTHRLGPAVSLITLPCASDHMEQCGRDQDVTKRLGVDGQRYWLAVGSANPTKNFSRLVEAFCLLPRSLGVRMVIVGGRNDRVFSSAQSDFLGDDRLIWAGPVSNEELRTLYEHALAFAFPSTYEGFGLPPLEAMNCCCPVAAAHAASIPEACGDAVLYFDPYSISDISEALHRLTVDDELRTRLIERGRNRTRQHTWEGAAVLLLENLQRIGALSKHEPVN